MKFNSNNTCLMRTQLGVAARTLKLAYIEKIKNMAIFVSFYFNLVVKLKKSADASGHGARNTFWLFFRFYLDLRKIEINALQIPIKLYERNLLS